MRSIVLSLVVLLLLPSTALAFTCRGRIVSEGDQIDIVTTKCGEPMSRRLSKYGVTGPYTGTSPLPGGGQATVVYDVETLVYSCGEGRLMHVLTFKDGKLQKLETAGHGSGPRMCE